jgi:uncharacterized protein (DUF305 family)
MNRTTTMRRALSAGAALALLLAAAGCGSGVNDDGMTPAAPTGSAVCAATFNDADAMFAQLMIPHHQQAVEMSTLAETRAQDPELKKLAATIKAAQQPEITTMTGWLTAWGQPTTAPTATGGMGGMGGMDHGGGSGMMSTEDMGSLAATSGVAFDRMYATMMIAHHNGAIQMAQDEAMNGTNADAKSLAKSIIKSQMAEVVTLQAIEKRLG